MFDDAMIAEVAKVATQMGIELAALLAITEVESAGQAFATVKGKPEPLIRFEGHYFDRRLSLEKRVVARRRKLASPIAGMIANPKTQSARWDMVARAASIDAKVAYEAVSWGVGQVMGAHWAWLGYANVDALVAEARSGIGGQVRLMAKFIVKSGLSRYLVAKEWPAFARGYNGPNYKAGRYDEKLAAAYRKHRAARASTSPSHTKPVSDRPVAILAGLGPVRSLVQQLGGLYAAVVASRKGQS